MGFTGLDSWSDPIPQGIILWGNEPSPVLSIDFTVLPTGVLASLPGGLNFSRASSASVQDSPNTVVTAGITTDVARVGRFGSVNGLLFEGSTVNLFATPRAPQSWAGAPSGGSSTVGNSTAGPDGQVLAALHSVLSGGYGRFYSSATMLSTTGVPFTVSNWMKEAGGSSFQHNLYYVNTSTNRGGTLTSGWNRYSITVTPTSVNGSYVPADGRDGTPGGGIAAGVRNLYSDMAQLEQRVVPSSWVSGTRAGERIWTAASSVVSYGRVRIQLEWTALYSSSQMPFNGRLWTIDANNFVEIDAVKLRVRVVTGGIPVLLPTVLSWAAGDVLEIRVDAGNAPPLGWYAVNGGARTDLGTGVTQGEVLAEGASIDLMCNGTVTQLEGGFQTLVMYGSGTAAISTIYASPTGNGVGTLADPCSITQAQILSRATGKRVVLRGGRYELAAPLAFTTADNNLSWLAYPGETPILSGGTVITGSWTGPDGSGVYTKSFSGHTRQLYVAGTRCIRARSSVQSGWTPTATGWTASDSTIAGYAHPEDVEVIGSSSLGIWKQFHGFVASASGTTITMRDPDWAQSQDAAAGYEWNTVWWYEGVPELVTSAGYWAHDRHSNTLYYKPRAGEVMGTSQVIVGNLETILTVAGTQGDSVTGLSFTGITFSDATWLEPDSEGYAPIQDGIIGSGERDSPNLHKTPAAVRMSYCDNVIFYGCTFSHLGAVGLSLDTGTRNCSVVGCTTFDTSGGGISVGNASSSADYAPASELDWVTNNRIYSCLISQSGREYWSNCGITGGYVSHLTIDHCEIDETHYTGISIGWGWGLQNASPPEVLSENTVTNTKISNWMKRDSATLQQLGDGGGVYLNNLMSGTVVNSNYVIHDGSFNGGKAGFCLYIDNGGSGIAMTNNVAAGCTWGVIQPFAPVAYDNVATGNYYSNPNPIAYDPDNIVANNTFESPFGASALAIISNAGRV